MSVLDRPRLLFKGTMSVSTPTANNNNYDLVLDPDNVALFPKFAAMSDDAFREAMRKLVIKNLTIINEGFEEVLESNWDYYGENSVVLQDTVVTGYDPPSGARVTAGDPIIGAPVGFFGNKWGDDRGPAIIVDNDPTGDISSQMFIDQVTIGGGAAGASITAETTEAARVPRTYSRWLDLLRNMYEFPDACFAAIWQLALPNDVLAFAGDASPAVATLAKAARDGRGLVARFCTYLFQRTYTDPQLAQLFAQGQYPQNHSAGVILGAIGPWRDGELGSVPAGRRLDPVATFQNAIPKRFVQTYTLGPAVAEVKAGVVALDLATAFPEVDGKLDKVDYGEALLQVVPAGGGEPVTIGPVPYDKATYEAGAGIVEISFDADQRETIDGGRLQVVAPTASKEPLLAEVPMVAESDDRSVYLTVGETTSITVQVTQAGGALTGPRPLAVQQYRSTQKMGETTDGTSPLPMKELLLTPNDAEPVVTISPQATMVDGGAVGEVQLTLTGIAPGLAVLRFLPGTDNPPDPTPGDFTAWMLPYFVNVRVLPADAELDAIPDDQVTWELVYDKVLRYFWRMYPTMDAHLRLNDKAQVDSQAQIISLLVDESSWFSTLYMPITRDLSGGKRRLLQRYCARVQAGQTT